MITTKIFYPHEGREIPAIRYDLPKTETGKKYPIFIFLHGSGEYGDGTLKGLSVLENSLHHRNLLIAAEKHEFLVFAPQYVIGLMEWIKEWGVTGKYVDSAIEYVKKNLPVDPARIILVGYSAGGNGVFTYITRNQSYTDKLSCAVAITSNFIEGNYECIAKSHLPVIAYHAKDDTSPLKYTATLNNIANANKYNPVPKAEAIILETGGHGICESVLSSLNYEKILSYRNAVEPIEEPAFVPNATITHENGTEERIRIIFDQSLNL